MIKVLRLSHRRDRDKRVTTHVGLVARAFGADGLILSGDKDESVISSLERISKEWGGDFTVEYQKDWRKVISGFKGCKVHLTMYGEKLSDKISEIKKQKDLLIIVGSEKIPPDAYQNSDYNISVGTQPHSEIAALSLTLDRYFDGKQLDLNFKEPKREIIPQKKGKKVIEK